MSRLFCFLMLSVFVLIGKIRTTPAGWCYQCNSRNPLCGNNVDPSLSGYMTPCNGQCYTYSHRNVLYRGCSWEHGFMAHEPQNILVYDKNSIWLFCDKPFCNKDANILKEEICDGSICSSLTFPDACKQDHINLQCALECGNPLCFSK